MQLKAAAGRPRAILPRCALFGGERRYTLCVSRHRLCTVSRPYDPGQQGMTHIACYAHDMGSMACRMCAAPAFVTC